jgi:hypothetical protein
MLTPIEGAISNEGHPWGHPWPLRSRLSLSNGYNARQRQRLVHDQSSLRAGAHGPGGRSPD